MKLWSGMLEGNLDKITEEFNQSIKVDKRLVFVDIRGSIAHVKMLKKQAILKNEEADKIIEGLKQIYKDLENKKIAVDESFEDVHSFVEGKLIEYIGEDGKKMHTARSRNDQIALDLRMYLKDQSKEIVDLLKTLLKVLANKAKDHTETIMPGMTHLQPAQPVTFAHHLLSYAFMVKRDIERIKDAYKRVDYSPLGSCALAGTGFDIDREYTKDLLGFENLCQNSMDAVSDRDFCLEIQSDLALIGVHLSKLSEELIIFSSNPYKFIEIDDAYATGSSIMPQKKNPDMAELIRGKSARLIGNMNQSFVMVKGLANAYAKDLQEDKESLFDSIDTVKISLKIMAGMIDTLGVNKERMKKACKEGFLNATDLADYLVDKGLSFRDSHHLSAKACKYCIENDISLDEMDIKEYKKISKDFDEDLYDAIKIENSFIKRDSLGGVSPKEVKRQIEVIEKYLGE